MQTFGNDRKIMSAKQAANEYFKNTISYWKLLELVKAGKIPCFKVGSRILFRREALDQWVQELEQNKHQAKTSNEVKPLKKIQSN